MAEPTPVLDPEGRHCAGRRALWLQPAGLPAATRRGVVLRPAPGGGRAGLGGAVSSRLARPGGVALILLAGGKSNFWLAFQVLVFSDWKDPLCGSA
jgi:hypothetical protein